MNNVTENCSTPWCVDHTARPDGTWCTGRAINVSGEVLHLSTATEDGQPAIFGLAGDPLTPTGARDLALLLLHLADTAEQAPVSHQAGEKLRCERHGCDSAPQRKRHTIAVDGSVVHRQSTASHMARDEDGELHYLWRTGLVARDEEPWAVSLEVEGITVELDDEQAEELAQGLTRAALQGLRHDLRDAVRAATEPQTRVGGIS